jgi:hypothetical protein
MDWFNNLPESEKKYIKEHPDPSHMIFYLKKHISFNDSIKMAYQDYVEEDIKLTYNLSIAKENIKHNIKNIL